MIGWSIRTRGLQPIGLDIGHNSIKMIQLVINGGQISVLAADNVCIEAGIDGDEDARKSFIVSAIKQMLTRGKFRGRNVVSCLPSNKLKITSLRLAETETEGIEQALKKEAGQRFGLDPEKDIINYLIAGNIQYGNEVKSELILFAASDEVIRSHIEILEEVQLRPVAIDTVPCALFRSFERSRRREEDKEQTVVFVDVGDQFTTVVFGRGGEISFTKQIPFGGEKFYSEIASRLGVSIEEAKILRDKLRIEGEIRKGISLDVPESSSLEQSEADSIPEAEQDGNALDTSTRGVIVDAIRTTAEELAREISLCLRYYTVTFRGKLVERAVFSGGGAYEGILLDVLGRHLTAKIEVAQPLKGLDVTNVNFDNNERSLCEWAVAVGLGLKGWDKDQRQL